MSAVSGGWLSSQRKSLFWIAAIDAVVLAIILGLTFASGGFDAGVVAGGLSLALFVAIMLWFVLGIRSAGYRPQHAIYDAEFHAIQTDQQLIEPGPIHPRRTVPGLHPTMAGVVLSLLVLMFVFAAL